MTGMLGRWWYAVIALAMMVGGIGAPPRVQVAEGRSEAFRADALVRGGFSAVKRAKAARGENRAAEGSAPAMVPVVVDELRVVRAWVRVELGAVAEADGAVARRAATARAPPAQS